MDNVSKIRRHEIMSSIKTKDTGPELIVRKYLWKHKFRFRLNYKRLPGSPDIVLPKYKIVIFVNGCFWHGHKDCKIYTFPKTNVQYWRKKIDKNIERDTKVHSDLKEMGWRIMTVWECQLKKNKRSQTLEEIENIILKTYLEDSKINKCKDNIVSSIAAEEVSEYKI